MAIKSKRVTVFNQIDHFDDLEKDQARRNIGVDFESPNSTINIEYDEENEKFNFDVDERTHFLIGRSYIGDASGYDTLDDAQGKKLVIDPISIQPNEHPDVYINAGDIIICNGTYTYNVIFEIKVASEINRIAAIKVEVGSDSFIASIDMSYAHIQTVSFGSIAIAAREESSSLPIKISIADGSDYEGGIQFKLSKVTVHKVGTKIVGTTENVIELLEAESVTDPTGGVLDVNADNTLTKLTLTSSFSGSSLNINFQNPNNIVPNFVVEIDNQSSSDITIVITENGSTPLCHSSIAGTEIKSDSFAQITCLGRCWTLAEFEEDEI